MGFSVGPGFASGSSSGGTGSIILPTGKGPTIYAGDGQFVAKPRTFGPFIDGSKNLLQGPDKLTVAPPDHPLLVMKGINGNVAGDTEAYVLGAAPLALNGLDDPDGVRALHDPLRRDRPRLDLPVQLARGEAAGAVRSDGMVDRHGGDRRGRHSRDRPQGVLEIAPLP